MGIPSLTRYEQETIINYNNGDKLVSLYTADTVVMKKLDKLVEKYPDTYKMIKQDSVSKTYEFSKKLISFRPPNTRVYTEEEKQILRDRLAAYRESQEE